MRSGSEFSRRRVMRGILGGSAVAVGLPLLNIALNNSGTALASGEALPVCFGTWFYGLGLNPGHWEPKVRGVGYNFRGPAEALEDYRAKINVYSGLVARLDEKGNQAHYSGVKIIHNAVAPPPPGGKGKVSPSIDTIISDAIGNRSRFRSLEVSCDGNPRTSWSNRGADTNPAEVSPVALYGKIFGKEFRDPNAAEFTPEAEVVLRHSALSYVSEDRQRVLNGLGTDDRQRLDQYFTSLRELENQLSVELQKPAPLAACTLPSAVAEGEIGTDVESARNSNKLFARLLAHTLACGQTRVFNMAISQAGSTLRKAGVASTHHILSHEEPMDTSVGYQPTTTWFQERYMEMLRDVVAAMDGIREGDQTLLDRSVILVSTDVGYAKTHDCNNIPVFSIGGANGKLKTGIHVAAPGDTPARVGLTLQQAIGLPVQSWGTDGNQTSKAFSEVLA
ncbi:MAG: DUF1552 domain-containing protein [Rhodospirillaceae bacterium]